MVYFILFSVYITSTSSQPSEATEVQAINDFILFTVAGAGSLISGVIYADFGKFVSR